MKQHYKQFSVFLGFVMVSVLALGFNVALLVMCNCIKIHLIFLRGYIKINL